MLAAWLTLAPLGAQDFATSNAQLLVGRDFQDRTLGNHVTSGPFTTLTLEHFRAGRWGDVFGFVDINHGRLADFLGQRRDRDSQAYGELAPRLSLSGLSGFRLETSWLKDVFLAGQLNQGDTGFRAWLYGLGVDFKVPGFAVASLNAYARKDPYNRSTLQLTAVWLVPFSVGSVSGRFEGFVDAHGTDQDGTDVLAQPQLLLDVGKPFGAKAGRWWLGVEPYWHHSRTQRVAHLQALFKVILP